MIEPYSSSWEDWLQKWFIRLLIPAIIINAGGLLIRILEPDGALYASIAKTIAQTGDFINLRVEGRDWLDKPHFPFWMAALSMRLFGINSFAYKLPAVLFWALGGWYTWRFALSLYGKTTARLSVLVYVSAAQLVISNNDVRAEPYLTGLVIAAVYHFYRASRTRPGIHLLAGSFFAACAMMTKGPFVLITVGAGFILDWISGKEWDQFWNKRWWIALALIALFIIPELYCLYIQFDLHPEKLIFGHTKVSGIRFFFWDSQFGRFFNSGPIKGSGDPFFFFHTLLWVFLPWSLLLYAAVFRKSRSLSRRSMNGDLICAGAAVISFAVFSMSRFQLPYYLNLLFPFFSILTAEYLVKVRRPVTEKTINIIQQVIVILLPLLLLLICWFYHFSAWPLIMTVLLLLSVAPFFLFRGKGLTTAIGRSYWIALLVYAFISFLFYPSILHYQAGTEAGFYIGKISDDPSGPAFRTPATVYSPAEAPANYSFEFYCPLPVERRPMADLPVPQHGSPVLVFAPTSFADSLALRGYRQQEVRRFPDFHVSQLTGEFMNFRTRSAVLHSYSIFSVTR